MTIMVKKPILGDIRILDMTTVMFGPYCTETLAAMGADVIKLEPAGGDESRRVWKPNRTRRMGPLHLTMNRGKRSIDWDIKTGEGAEDLRALIPGCDVIIHNLREQAAIRAGLDYEAVRALRPDIIHVHCTGFGREGPYAGQPAYDDIIQALSGTASLQPMVTGGGPPRFLPTALADKVSGLHAAYAVLAALYHREHSGEGQAIEVPMFEAVTHFLLQEHMYGRVFDPPNAPAGYPRQLDPDRQPMATRDGYIVIAPYTDERWLRLFTLLSRADLFEQEALSTPLLRLHNVTLMQKELEAMLPGKDSEEWLDLLRRHDIPACRVNSLDDLFDDPHLKAVGFFENRTHPTEGNYLGMRSPVRFGAGGESELLDARAIGEDSDAVRRELGR